MLSKSNLILAAAPTEMMAAQSFGLTLAPVSYTHLDVYKRQGKNMCNPILQAKRLNREGTELNIVVGLCVGHDSLFYRYSDALVTTLVAKDRVTGHNPAAVLYQLDSYYKRLLTPSDPA